jgi:hypothetical protein
LTFLLLLLLESGEELLAQTFHGLFTLLQATTAVTGT